jgi:hypothetical protein
MESFRQHEYVRQWQQLQLEEARSIVPPNTLCILFLLRHYASTMPALRSLELISDGASSQFKQAPTLFFLSSLPAFARDQLHLGSQFVCSWDFFQAGHGKGIWYVCVALSETECC